MSVCTRCGRENVRGELVCRACGAVMRPAAEIAEVATAAQAETGLDLTVDRSIVSRLATQIADASQIDGAEPVVGEIVERATKRESPTLGPSPTAVSTSATTLKSDTQSACHACGAEQIAGSRFCSACAAPMSDLVADAPLTESALVLDRTAETELEKYLESPSQIENGAVAAGVWTVGMPAGEMIGESSPPRDNDNDNASSSATTPSAEQVIRRTTANDPTTSTRSVPKPADSLGKTLALFVFAGAAMWKLIVAVLIVVTIIGYVWGGSNQAHLDCLAHRFGDTGLVAQFACVVVH